MSRYESIDCPICQKPLENGEEIVVCPECGAPYHRKCIQQEGICIFPQLHEKGEAWTPPQKKPEEDTEKYDKDASLRCSRCGTVNPPHGIFCQVCGNKLNDDPIPPQGQGQPSGMPPFGANGFPPSGIPLNPYTTPFGGVAPDEEIDGVPAKDMAIFVGKNSHYYLPHFKRLSQSGRKVLNWSAFLFEGGYFLYRKMYGIAILVFAVTLLLSAPNAVLTIRTMELGATGLTTAETANLQMLSTASTVCSFLSLGVRFFCGIMANTLYKGHAKRIILREKAIKRSQEEYNAALSKKGSVAIKLVTGLLIAYAAISMIGTYLMILLGGI